MEWKRKLINDLKFLGGSLSDEELLINYRPHKQFPKIPEGLNSAQYFSPLDEKTQAYLTEVSEGIATGKRNKLFEEEMSYRQSRGILMKEEIKKISQQLLSQHLLSQQLLSQQSPFRITRVGCRVRSRSLPKDNSAMDLFTDPFENEKLIRELKKWCDFNLLELLNYLLMICCSIGFSMNAHNYSKIFAGRIIQIIIEFIILSHEELEIYSQAKYMLKEIEECETQFHNKATQADQDKKKIPGGSFVDEKVGDNRRLEDSPEKRDTKANLFLKPQNLNDGEQDGNSSPMRGRRKSTQLINNLIRHPITQDELKIAKAVPKIKYIFSMLIYTFNYSKIPRIFLFEEDSPEKTGNKQDFAEFSSPTGGHNNRKTSSKPKSLACEIFNEEKSYTSLFEKESPYIEDSSSLKRIKQINKYKLKDVSTSLLKRICKMEKMLISDNKEILSICRLMFGRMQEAKTKKWLALTKITEQEKKKKTIQSVMIKCKICLKEVKIMDLKQHTGVCKAKEDLNKGIYADLELIKESIESFSKIKRYLTIKNILQKNKMSKKSKELSENIPKIITKKPSLKLASNTKQDIPSTRVNLSTAATSRCSKESKEILDSKKTSLVVESAANSKQHSSSMSINVQAPAIPEISRTDRAISSPEKMLMYNDPLKDKVSLMQYLMKMCNHVLNMERYISDLKDYAYYRRNCILFEELRKKAESLRLLKTKMDKPSTEVTSMIENYENFLQIGLRILEHTRELNEILEKQEQNKVNESTEVPFRRKRNSTLIEGIENMAKVGKIEEREEKGRERARTTVVKVRNQVDDMKPAIQQRIKLPQKTNYTHCSIETKITMAKNNLKIITENDSKNDVSKLSSSLKAHSEKYVPEKGVKTVSMQEQKVSENSDSDSDSDSSSCSSSSSGSGSSSGSTSSLVLELVRKRESPAKKATNIPNGNLQSIPIKIILQPKEAKTEHKNSKSSSPRYKFNHFDDSDINYMKSAFNFDDHIEEEKRNFSDDAAETYHRSSNILQTIKEIPEETIGIKDFEYLKVLGKGAFGRVWLVKRILTEDMYAMKLVSFENTNMNQIEALKKEKEIFQVVSSEFVVRAIFTFSVQSCVCFVMEYMPGGDLSGVLEECGVMDEKTAKFYISELILAVEYLHSIGIIHRDLKPENLLINSEGHLKLSDFGLSEIGAKSRNYERFIGQRLKKNSILKNNSELKLKYLEPDVLGKPKNKNIASELKKAAQEKKQRIIGTPDYIAPESLNGSLNEKTLDWWSVGVILFEFLVGIPPFNDESPEKVFENIRNHKIPWEDISIGEGEDCVSREAYDLINQLLEPQPSLRLGHAGSSQIKGHTFFSDIKWETLKLEKAPYIPDQLTSTDKKKIKKMNETDQESPLKLFAEDILNPIQTDKPLDPFNLRRVDILDEQNRKVIDQLDKNLEKVDGELENIKKEIMNFNEILGGSDCDDEDI